MKVLEFSLKRKEQSVTLDGAPYKIVELDGETRDAIMEDNFSRLGFTADGKPLPMLKNVRGIQSKLLAACVFDGAGKLVPESVIIKWPATTVEALYAMAQELSGLTTKGKEEVLKNDSAVSAGTGTP